MTIYSLYRLGKPQNLKIQVALSLGMLVPNSRDRYEKWQLNFMHHMYKTYPNIRFVPEKQTKMYF